MTEETLSEYPKYVDHPEEITGKTKDGKLIPRRVIVHNANEEAELSGKKVKGWNTKSKDD